jgi:hypothetical protein
MTYHKKLFWKWPSMSVIVLCFAPMSIAAEQLATKRDRYAVPRKSATEIKATMETKDGSVALTVSDAPLLSYKSMVDEWRNGSFWVWGSGGGRPEAMLSLSTSGSRTRYYEFLSFSKDTLAFRIPGGPTWKPQASWEPKPVPDAKLPVDSRRRRLFQIRQIARRFAAFEKDYYTDPQNGFRREMRLLPQPIYRYPSESEESLDGAFFAFVCSGNLELLLAIEAEKDGSKGLRWVFAPYPVTVHELNLQFDKKPVWFLKNTTIGDAMLPTEKYFIHTRLATAEETSSEEAPSDR